MIKATEEESNEAISLIVQAAELMGWKIAILSDETEVVSGIVIGTEQFIAEELNNPQDFDIWRTGTNLIKQGTEVN